MINSCPSDDETRNTSNISEVISEGGPVKLSQLNYLCMLLLVDEDDLQDVRSAVVDLVGRWQELGVSLGIRQSNLDAILSDNSHSSSDCLRKMLSLWLRQAYKVWTRLIPPWASHLV